MFDQRDHQEKIKSQAVPVIGFGFTRAVYISALLLGVAAFGQEPAEVMTKMVVRVEIPDVPEESFVAKPKVLYRSGTRYCRTEEMPDPENGIHGLSIINEPDIWMVNLFTKTARHYVDPGPTFNCRMPIFVYREEIRSADDLKNPLFELEFGRELAYFQGRGSTPNPGPTLQGKATTAHGTDVGDWQLLLFTAGMPERPVAVVRQNASTREIFWYGAYEQIPFDAKLFAEPDGVKIEEAEMKQSPW